MEMLSLFLLTVIPLVKITSGCRIQADIMFLLDNSGSIGKGNFRNMVKFVQSFPGKRMEIGPNDLQIGVMSYHSFVHKEFSLDKYPDTSSFKDGVSKIRYHGGTSRTDKAIKNMYRSSFDIDNGARADTTKICIVITDGNSHHEYETKYAAIRAKKRGIVMFAIGVGYQINDKELDYIANDPDVDFVYKAQSAAALKYFRKTLIGKVCNVSRPKPPPGCSPKADIVFLLDSSGSITKTNFNLMLEFVKRFFKSFPIGKDAYQFGVVTFSNDAHEDIHLNDSIDVVTLMAAMDRVKYQGGGTNTDDALRLAHQSMFKIINGDRNSAPNILVTITDGHAGDHKSTVIEAAKVQQAGIKVFAVGIGSTIDWKEVNIIASDPNDDHVVSVADFSKLKENIESFTKKVCKDTHG